MNPALAAMLDHQLNEQPTPPYWQRHDQVRHHYRQHGSETTFQAHPGHSMAFIKDDPTVATSSTQFAVPPQHQQRKHYHHKGSYVCQYEGCGQRFSYGPGLRRHEKMKHETLPGRAKYDRRGYFVCNIDGCGIEFSFQTNLRRHERLKHGYYRNQNKFDKHNL